MSVTVVGTVLGSFATSPGASYTLSNVQASAGDILVGWYSAIHEEEVFGTTTCTWGGTSLTKAQEGADESDPIRPDFSLWYLVVSSGGTNDLTFNPAIGSSLFSPQLTVFKITGETEVYDTSVLNVGNSSTLPSSGNLSVAQADEVLLALVVGFIDIGSRSWGGSFTSLQQTDVGDPAGGETIIDSAYLIVSASGTYNAAMATSPAASWRAGMIAFKPAGPGPAFLARPNLYRLQAVKRASTW